MAKSESQQDKSPSQLIDARIKELGDWRGEMLGRLRALIKQAEPGVVEEWKWRGVPVWYLDGMICTGETYKSVVKMTFAKGAALKDPSELFNASLDGNARRAIDFHEGEKIDEVGAEGAGARRRGIEQVQRPRLMPGPSPSLSRHARPRAAFPAEIERRRVVLAALRAMPLAGAHALAAEFADHAFGARRFGVVVDPDLRPRDVGRHVADDRLRMLVEDVCGDASVQQAIAHEVGVRAVAGDVDALHRK